MMDIIKRYLLFLNFFILANISCTTIDYLKYLFKTEPEVEGIMSEWDAIKDDIERNRKYRDKKLPDIFKMIAMDDRGYTIYKVILLESYANNTDEGRYYYLYYFKSIMSGKVCGATALKAKTGSAGMDVTFAEDNDLYILSKEDAIKCLKEWDKEDRYEIIDNVKCVFFPTYCTNMFFDWWYLIKTKDKITNEREYFFVSPFTRGELKKGESYFTRIRRERYSSTDLRPFNTRLAKTKNKFVIDKIDNFFKVRKEIIERESDYLNYLKKRSRIEKEQQDIDIVKDFDIIK